MSSNNNSNTYSSFIARMALNATNPDPNNNSNNKAQSFKDNAAANAAATSPQGRARRPPPRSPPPPPSQTGGGPEHPSFSSSPFLTVPALNNSLAQQQLHAAAVMQQQRNQMHQFEQQQLAYFSDNSGRQQRGTSAVQVLAEEGFSSSSMRSPSGIMPPLIPRNFISSNNHEAAAYTPASVLATAAASEAATSASQKKIFAALDLLRKTPAPAGAAAVSSDPATPIPHRSYSPSSLFSNKKDKENNSRAPDPDEIEHIIMTSPTHQASLAINVARSAEAQRAKLSEFERTLDEAEKVNAVEQRLTDHQNDHTKLRAQRLMDVDRARWEVQRCEFRVVEVQAQMEAACVALQERLLSRVATLKQLQEDSIRQSEHRLRAEVRGQHDKHIGQFREHVSQRTATVESLSVALQQLSAHVEVQCASLEHDLVSNSNNAPGVPSLTSTSTSSSGATGKINAAIDRLVGMRHSLSADNQRANASVESMVTMLDNFGADAKRQLHEMAVERTAFQERMARRIEEMRAAKIANEAKNMRTASRAARGTSL